MVSLYIENKIYANIGKHFINIWKREWPGREQEFSSINTTSLNSVSLTKTRLKLCSCKNKKTYWTNF